MQLDRTYYIIPILQMKKWRVPQQKAKRMGRGNSLWMLNEAALHRGREKELCVGLACYSSAV